MSRTTVTLALLALASAALAEAPKPVDDRLEITLFAEHPTIVTPTGIDVDHAGRVWAIESNTHFPPDGYQRHDSDRLYVMQDTDGDGRADDVKVFADGFTHTMSVAVRPVWLSPVKSRESRVESQNEGTTQADASASARQVFLAERSTIWLLEDLDDDLKCDRRTKLIRLETPGNYPHNGLAGFAFDAMGWMYFGFGENLGAKYTVHGSDGTKLVGGGEGGNVYRCRPDGSKLQLWATGFWNPHASCVDAFGRLFTVDNDPDSRPPCRLLHVVEGGDYGFKFKNGRKGLHPFTSWNGEVPGTLPMVAGTGEAPSGIVAYESDGLPEDYLGNLLVTSWGDHRIDRFRLEPKGASFTSVAEPIVQGDDEFRPVGLATAPDGSLLCTDWVKRDYKLHGHGRIWRIQWKDRPETNVEDLAAISGASTDHELERLVRSRRLDVRRTAAEVLGDRAKGRALLERLLSDNEQSNRTRSAAFDALLGDESARETLEERLKTRSSFRRIASAVLATPLEVRSEERGDGEFDLLELTEPEKLAAISLMDRFALSLEPSQTKERRRLRRRQAKLSWNLDEMDTFALGAAVAWYRTDKHAAAPEFTEEIAANLSFFAFDRSGQYSVRSFTRHPEGFRLANLLTARTLVPKSVDNARDGLASASASMRRVAVQWAAEENLKELRPQVAAVLESPGVTPDLFRATIAALQMLDGVDPKEIDRTPPTQYVMSLVRDTERPANVRALALRMLGDGAGRDPKAKFDAALAKELLASDSPTLRLETVRTLQSVADPFAAKLARSVAADEKADAMLRAEAVVAIGRDPGSSRDLLLELLAGDDATLTREALRSLRPLVAEDVEMQKAIAAIDDDGLKEAVALARGEKPDLTEEAGLPEGGDAAAGRRLFFHASGPGCAECHTVDGRGGQVGPDLSLITRTADRAKLAESILQPSKEVAPQYTNWSFVMTDGKVRSGMILRQTRKLFEIGTPEGERVEFSSDLVETREPQKTSVMPDKLRERMTSAEFRDLLAYLESLK